MGQVKPGSGHWFGLDSKLGAFLGVGKGGAPLFCGKGTSVLFLGVQEKDEPATSVAHAGRKSTRRV